MSVGQDVPSKRNITISKYNADLDSLMDQFRRRELTHIHINARLIGDTEGLHNLVCAAGVGVDTRKRCTEGRRTEILKEIIDWIDDPTPTAPWQDLLASWSSWQGQLSHCTYNRFACAELRQTRIVLLLLPGQTGGKASREGNPNDRTRLGCVGH